MDVTSLTAYGYHLDQLDLFGSVFDVRGHPIQVIKTKRGGWQGRRKPRGRERTAILTSSTSTPFDVVLMLIHHAYLPATPGMDLTYRQLKKQRQRFTQNPAERDLTATTEPTPMPGRWR